MHQRIAVGFGSRRQEKPGAVLFRDIEHVLRPGGAGFQRLDRMLQIVFRTGERSQVQNRIEFSLRGKRLRDVAFDKIEIRMLEQVLHVSGGARHQIIQGNHTMVVGNQSVTEVRANETGGSRH